LSTAYSNKSVQLLTSLPDSVCIVVAGSLIRVLVGGGKKSLGTRISHSKGSLEHSSIKSGIQQCEDMVWHALTPNNSGVTTIGAGRAVTQDQNWLNGQLHKTHIDKKFETRPNLLPVLKIVTQTVHTV